MKIRIFALAKELGIDSKELIEYCNRAGVEAKNSALASISPEQRDLVIQFMETQQRSSGKSEAQTPMAPLRDDALESGGKVRKIEVAARGQGARSSRALGSGTATVEPGADEEAAEHDLAAELVDTESAPEVGEEADAAETQTPPLAEETLGVAAAAEAKPAPTKPAPKSRVAESRQTTDERSSLPETLTTETTSKDQTIPHTETSPAEVAERAPKKPKVGSPADAPLGPHRPEDYIAPGGAGGSSIRDMEMKPRANVTDRPRPGKPRPPKKPTKPAFPFMAPPPEMAAPKPKKQKPVEEPAAQKPVFKLSGDMLKGDAPLRRQLERHIEEKERETKGGKPAPGGPSDLKRHRDREQRELEESRDRKTQQQKRRRQRTTLQEEAQTSGKGIRRRKKSRKGPVVFKSAAEVHLPITIRSLSEALGRPARDLISILFKTGLAVKINDHISEETALELALELGVDLIIKRGRDIEEELVAQFESQDDPELLVERPPVITILGHVDHGKTTLLDKIRSANVAGGEAGGITQHIAAYQVEYGDKKLTFVDTPGHAAFGEMRARGANVTDIIVLVVAADDGVMPQTIECISHAKAAKVPMVVAMNKIDRPDTDEQRVLAELAAQDVLPAEWGGDVEVVRTSATTGQGIDTLLETLLLTAELREYKANPEAPAVGICLEAFRDEGRGVLAWFMVKKGTLRIGDVVLCGSASGRIRAMYDGHNQELQEAGPSTPVKIAGLTDMPGAGDHFFVMADIEEARLAALARRHVGRTETLGSSGRPKTLDDILNRAAGEVRDLPLIIKADTPGSLEALRGEITKFEHPEVRVEIVHEGVGGVNESDVSLASASGAIVIAFHVVADDQTIHEAERHGVEIRRYDIIYEITDHIKQALEGLLAPERVRETTGRALVLQTFKITRFGTIAGCRVLSGSIDRNNRVNVIRDQKVINDYDIASLKREKDDVKEVRDGMECGIRLAGFNDVKEGDLFEAYRVKEVKRTLS